MSIEALVARIDADAEAEAVRLLADADAAAAARVAEAEETARARVRAALAAAEPSILGAEARAINAARLRLVSLRTVRLAASAEEAFRLAEDRLTAIVRGDLDPGRWDAAVRRLAVETAALVGAGELNARPADIEAVTDATLAAASSHAIAPPSIVPDPRMPPGVRGRSADGRVTVDATVQERLRRARSALMPEVAALLRDAETTQGSLVGAGT